MTIAYLVPSANASPSTMLAANNYTLINEGVTAPNGSVDITNVDDMTANSAVWALTNLAGFGTVSSATFRVRARFVNPGSGDGPITYLFQLAVGGSTYDITYDTATDENNGFTDYEIGVGTGFSEAQYNAATVTLTQPDYARDMGPDGLWLDVDCFELEVNYSSAFPQTVGPLTGIASAEAIGSASLKYDQTISGTAGGIATAEAIGSATVLLDQAIIPTGIPGPDAGSGGTDTYYFDASVSGPTDNDAAWSSPEIDAFDGSLATDTACSREGTVDNDELRGTGSTAPASGNAISQVRVRLYAGVYIADNNTMFAEILDGVTSLGIAENHHDYQDKDWGDYVILDAPAGGWTWAKLNSIECVLYGSSDATGWHKVANRVDLEVTTSGTSSLGTPQLNLTLLMTGVATAEAVGTLSALAGNVDIVPTGIATVEAVGSLEVILAGGADQDLLSVGGIATVEAIGTLEILAGNVDVVPTGIATAEVVGDLTLLAGNVDVVPTGIATAEAIGSAQLDLTLVTTGIATAEAIGSAQLDLTLLMAGVATAEAIGDLTLLAGNVNVVPTGIASAEAIGDLEVTLGGGVPQYVSPDGVGSAEAVGSHTLAPGNVDIVATGIATAEAVGTPSVNYGILITGITSEELVPEPVLLPGNVNIGASGIATAEVVPDPLVESDPSIVPTGIASEETFGSANFLSEYTLVATGIASAETIGSHIATTGYIFVPTGVPSGEAHGSALIGMEITGVGGIATAEAIGSINVIDSTNHIGAIGIPTSEQIGTAVILGGAQYTSSIFSRVFHPTFRGIFRKTISTRF